MRVPYKIGLNIGAVLAVYEIWAFFHLKEWDLLVPTVIFLGGVSALFGYFTLVYFIPRTKKPLAVLPAAAAAAAAGFITASLLLELIL